MATFPFAFIFISARMLVADAHLPTKVIFPFFMAKAPPSMEAFPFIGKMVHP
jgi:hypothetical protein